MDDGSVPSDNINTHTKGGDWNTQGYLRGIKRFLTRSPVVWKVNEGEHVTVEDSGHESYKEEE